MGCIVLLSKLDVNNNKQQKHKNTSESSDIASSDRKLILIVK